MDESNRSDDKHVSTITLTRATAKRGDPYKAVIKVTIKRIESCAPHKSIDLEPCERLTELSIVGEVYCVGDRRGDPSSCGQCVDYIREYFGGITVVELCDLWDRWHLNGEPLPEDVLKRLGEICRALDAEGS